MFRPRLRTAVWPNAFLPILGIRSIPPWLNWGSTFFIHVRRKPALGAKVPYQEFCRQRWPGVLPRHPFGSGHEAASQERSLRTGLQRLYTRWGSYHFRRQTGEDRNQGRTGLKTDYKRKE